MYLKLIASALAILFLMLNITHYVYAGAYAWDDGAITLAFGRTFGESGRFAINQSSEIIEGTSSVLLALLASFFHSILNFSFYEFIIWSQVLSLVFLIMTLLALYVTIQKYFTVKPRAIIISITTCLLPMFTTEVMNGMEMTLFSTLIILYIYAYENSKDVMLFMLIPLILLTRFEAIFYLPLSLAALSIIDKENIKKNLLIIAYTIIFFTIFTLIRIYTFNDFMPNTIWAKMNIPYTNNNLREKINGAIEFIYVFGALISFTILYSSGQSKLKYSKISLWLISSFFIFSFISGKNWGYDGRMFLAAIPVYIVLLSSILYYKNIDATLISQPCSTTGTAENKNFKVIMAALLLTLLISTPLTIKNFYTAAHGGFRQNFALPNIIKSNITDSKFYGVTPENYKLTGLAIQQIGALIKKNPITYMGPDVGGLALCCQNINIIDSALLTNKTLAHKGYSYFEDVLRKEIPDVIETHEVWAKVSKIYELKYFTNNYAPIIFNKNLFWLHIKHIKNSRNLVFKKIKPSEIPSDTRYFTDIQDIVNIKSNYKFIYLVE